MSYGTCKGCGCTDADCSQCIAKTGNPCAWVDETHELCSACAEEQKPIEWICKAQRKVDGKWVEGYFVQGYLGLARIFPKNCLLDDEGWQVKPETVKRFTGFTDRLFSKVFEDDTVMVEYKNGEKTIMVKCVVKWVNQNSHSFFAVNVNEENVSGIVPHVEVIKKPGEMYFTLRKETIIKI